MPAKTDVAPKTGKRPLLTPADAAAYLGVSERWIRRGISNGYFPYIKLGPRKVMIDPDDLDALREENRKTGDERW